MMVSIFILRFTVYRLPFTVHRLRFSVYPLLRRTVNGQRSTISVNKTWAFPPRPTRRLLPPAHKTAAIRLFPAHLKRTSHSREGRGPHARPCAGPPDTGPGQLYR